MLLFKNLYRGGGIESRVGICSQKEKNCTRISSNKTISIGFIHLRDLF